MSKRSFSYFSPEETDTYDAVSSILQNAEELLKAAQTLKDELDGKRQDGDAVISLAVISRKMLPALDFFDKYPSIPASKVPRLDKQQSHSEPKPGPIRIPSPVCLTRWTPSDIPASLPPLPSILNPFLERAALTHTGLARAGEMSYERLEWIGDACLYLISSSFIYQTFPKLPAGRCAQLREVLVRNLTLSKYTMDYNIHKRTRFPPEFDLRSDFKGYGATQKNKTKVLGDVFESYVAGVIMSDPQHGFANVCAWLKALWAKELEEDITKEYRNRPAALGQSGGTNGTGPGKELSESTAGKDLNPKVLLSQSICAKGVKISYIDQDSSKRDKKTGEQLFTVGAYLDGWGVTHHPLGFGSALSKREAGAKAAQAALNNKKMIKGFEEKKKQFLEAQEAQKELENLTA